MLLQIGTTFMSETVHTQMLNHGELTRAASDLDIVIRIGCELQYRVPVPTPAYLVLRPRSMAGQRIDQELFTFSPRLHSTGQLDGHGSILDRVTLQPGLNTIRHDAIVAVPSTPERIPLDEMPVPVNQLSAEVLRYTLPSRYCDSDRLMKFAAEKFGHLPPGGPTVRAICDWLHQNIEYRAGSGSPQLSAFDIVQRGFGVCRDFAHSAVALCRSFNLPTRYATGHLPNIGNYDPDAHMDFHAYFEVFLDRQWITMDARFNRARIGRVKISCGMDAVDGDFSTVYGTTNLNSFEVWAYQIDPSQVSIGGPIDLTKRLDNSVADPRFL
jgi:transglutaminase-like putative cysteine protease